MSSTQPLPLQWCYPYMTVKQKHSVVVARQEAAAARRIERQHGRKRIARLAASGIVSAGVVGAGVWRLLRARRI
jgi:hypothetical protein